VLGKQEGARATKMMEIIGHVWLLEKIKAKTRFPNVWGNQEDAPR
jgi:hypothetical protein